MFSLFLGTAFLFFSSCSQGPANRLQREELFSLEIGKMEDNLDLVEHYGVPYTEKSRIFMRNGFFYISNGNSSKVMEFNSYGDILSLLYSSERNPAPIMLQTENGADTISSRKAYAYPFRRVGEIAVTETGILLVEERAQDYQIGFDEELGTSLNTIILRFSGNGEIQDFLGQEGVGGTPFPYVEKVFVTDGDGIAVISRGIDRWIAFLFESNGSLIRRIDFLPEELPLPENGETYVNPSIKAVFPAYEGRELYVISDYYSLADGKGSVNFSQSAVCIYDPDTETWSERVILPSKKVGQDANGFLEDNSFVTIYDALGVDSKGNFFFIAPESEDSFELMTMGRDGSVKNRSTILLEDDEIIYRDLYLSSEGIVTALLAYEYEAKVVWWRSDKILENR
jgi:hypothetical protein